jgi:hypothetical protein
MYKYLILLFVTGLTPLVYADEISNPIVINFIKDDNNDANTIHDDICDVIKCQAGNS